MALLVRTCGFVLYLLNVSFCVAMQGPRNRRCCKYSLGSSSVSGTCKFENACIVKVWPNLIVSPPLRQCIVFQDSKTIATKEALEGCLNLKFEEQLNNWPYHFEELPFVLSGYLFKETALSDPIPGIEISLKYDDTWTDLRFRFINLELCNLKEPDKNVACFPRCVNIRKSNELCQKDSYLLYDCEYGGFHLNGTGSIISTSENLYQLDICLSHQVREEMLQIPRYCESFWFVMPSVTNAGNLKSFRIPLMQRRSFEKDKVVKILIPESFYDISGNESLTFSVERKLELEKKWTAILSSHISKFADNSTILLKENDLQMLNGWYRVVAGNRKVIVAKFRVNVGKSFKLTSYITITVIFILLFIMIIYCFLAKKMYKRKKFMITSKNLEMRVLIITIVDNEDHKQITRVFGNYLKNHCGISEVHFVLEKTGVKSYPNHDPGKWLKHSSVRSTTSKNSFLIFMGAPSVRLGQDFHSRLPNRRAFVATKYLQEMIEEDRVAVLFFRYSDRSTIPAVVPSYLIDDYLLLPKDMGKLLYKLSNIKKVDDHNFIETDEGQKIIQMVENLYLHTNFTSNINEERIMKIGSSLTSYSEEFEDLVNQQENSLNLNEESYLQPLRSEKNKNFEIEPSILSLKEEISRQRDQNTDPDLICPNDNLDCSTVTDRGKE